MLFRDSTKPVCSSAVPPPNIKKRCTGKGEEVKATLSPPIVRQSRNETASPPLVSLFMNPTLSWVVAIESSRGARDPPDQ